MVGKDEELHALKRVFIHATPQQHDLSFQAPDAPGLHTFKVALMSDSYLGLDQEYEFEVNVSAEQRPNAGSRLAQDLSPAQEFEDDDDQGVEGQNRANY